MEIKNVPSANFLHFKTRTTIGQLADFLMVGQRLYREAVDKKLFISGPVQWHYYDFNGSPAEHFDLEIAIPVAELPAEYDGEFHVKRSSPFRCISTSHPGTWETIPETYGKIIQFAKNHGLVPVAINREVYVHFDFQHPEGNITEIQFGVL